MGLDMYLYARKETFVGRYIDDSKGAIKLELPEELKDFKDTWGQTLIKKTDYEIAYWRKANAIHKWFVDNCAEGVDDCREMWVDIDKLRDLRDLCERVLLNNDLAEKLLPTESGFFFGGTEYDEDYFRDIEYTKQVCEKAIKLLENDDLKEGCYSIIYRASW